MFSPAIKRLMRRSARTLRKLQGVPQQSLPDAGPCDHMAAQYTLNPLFASIMRENSHQYVWPSVQAAKLAKHLGFDRVSFIEFGVAGGNSLIALEAISRRLEDHFEINIEVYGFDTGVGLPRPQDYRDIPNLWSESDFRMDEEKLRHRLTKAHLILGAVDETVASFIERSPASVAFIAFDLDYYSSTVQAFRLLDAEQGLLLPRVHCYFDDIMGYTLCEFNGERLAISEFNAAHSLRKIASIPGIRYYVPQRFASLMWEKNYMLHIFDHSLYTHNDGSVMPHGVDLRPL